MKPTNEQIIAEAKRRWDELMMTSASTSTKSVQDFIIEVMRENWTPPEPSLDVLAYREWAAKEYPGDAEDIQLGIHDNSLAGKGFLAGIKAGCEQNQKRIEELVEGLKSIAIVGQNHLLATMAAQTLSKSGEPGWVATRDELR